MYSARVTTIGRVLPVGVVEVVAIPARANETMSDSPGGQVMMSPSVENDTNSWSPHSGSWQPPTPLNATVRMRSPSSQKESQQVSPEMSAAQDADGRGTTAA